jgi:ubiquitin-like protein Pup
MSEQMKKTPQKQSDEEAQETEAVVHDVSETMDEIDDLLADIDAVLDEDAQGFVSSFIQKGGQ